MASETAPPIATFSIGWIAALSHELTAARLMLDKEYPDAPQDFDPSSSDTNTHIPLAESVGTMWLSQCLELAIMALSLQQRQLRG